MSGETGLHGDVDWSPDQESPDGGSPDGDSPDGDSPDGGLGFWLLPILLCVILAAMLSIGWPWAQQADKRNEVRGLDNGRMGSEKPGQVGWVPATRPSGQTVALTIDFGNGAKREFSDLPWRSGMTVADLMKETRHFQPPITYTQQGTGARAFLTTLEGVPGHVNDGKFWFFEINGTRGTCSFGAQSLMPEDHVLWTFSSTE